MGISGSGLTASAFIGGTIDDTVIGGTTPAAATFSTLSTDTNVGTVGTNVTAVERGWANNHVTTLTLSSLALTIGDTATLADGVLIYTFPAGAIIVDAAYMSVGVNLTTGTPTTDQPDVGLGTVIASGAVAVLDTPSTFEDIMTGQTAADVAGTATVLTLQTTKVIEVGEAHTVHFNIADTWANVTDTAATASGTVVLKWALMI
jgi:hypothetical protein